LHRHRLFWLSPFVVFTIIMLLKIYMAWDVIFNELPVTTPMLVGIPSVWVTFCLIELFARKRKMLVYMIVNTLLTSIYFAAIMYHKYYGVIVTYRALQQANQVTQVKGSVISLMHPYFLLIYTDIVVIALLFLWNKKSRGWGKTPMITRRAVFSAVLTLSLVFCFVHVWENRGIMNEIKKAQSMGILNYEVYTMIADMNRDMIDPKTITQQEIDKLKNAGEAAGVTVNYKGAAEGKNVIVLQMESLQNFLIGLQIDGQEITPVLNRLTSNEWYFPHVYQQAGQGNTSDAEFILNTSFYIPPNGAASQIWGKKDLPSLPKLFKEKGYRALTFHTNDVTFWNRKELYTSLGFDKYYDRQFFGDEDFVAFGSSDEVLYRKTTEELARLQSSGQKFYANIISMSAHHPFELPPEKERIKLPERYADTFVGNYLRSQNYADYALGQFIDGLKKSKLWDTTVVVMYGDHLGLPVYSLTAEEVKMMEEFKGRVYDNSVMMNIPLIMHVPGAKTAEIFNQVGGQTDFMPTIANLAGISLDNHIHFGQDLLNHTSNLLPERYYMPSGSFINNETVFIPGKEFQDGVAYPIEKGRTITDLSAYRNDYERALKLLNMSDSYVEHLPERK
jgi:lipoteichoic acid synthase